MANPFVDAVYEGFEQGRMLRRSREEDEAKRTLGAYLTAQTEQEKAPLRQRIYQLAPDLGEELAAREQKQRTTQRELHADAAKILHRGATAIKQSTPEQRPAVYQAVRSEFMRHPSSADWADALPEQYDAATIEPEVEKILAATGLYQEPDDAGLPSDIRSAEYFRAHPEALETAIKLRQAGGDEIAKRERELAGLESRGARITPEDRQQYLRTGKFPEPEGAPGISAGEAAKVRQQAKDQGDAIRTFREFETALKATPNLALSQMDSRQQGRLQTAYGNARAALRIVYNTGVLQPGELPMLEAALANPSGWRSFDPRTRNMVMGQLEQIYTRAQGNIENLVNSYPQVFNRETYNRAAPRPVGAPSKSAAKPAAGSLTPAEEAELNQLRARFGRK